MYQFGAQANRVTEGHAEAAFRRPDRRSARLLSTTDWLELSTATPNKRSISCGIEAMGANCARLITRTLGRAAFTPCELAFVCLARGNDLISGSGLPGKPPNQRYGPSAKVCSSKISQTTQPLGFSAKRMLTLCLAVVAPRTDDFSWI